VHQKQGRISSSEKARDLTQPVCPERLAVWLPVVASMVMMSQDPRPTAIVSPQCARDRMVSSKETVREHVPQSVGSPLTTLTSCKSSGA